MPAPICAAVSFIDALFFWWRWWAGGSTRGMFWLGAAFRMGNHVGPLEKTSSLYFSPTSLFFGFFFPLASGTIKKKELISSLKLLVSDGKFLSLPVFKPARGLKEEAFFFIGQVSSVYPHPPAHPPAGSSGCHFNHSSSVL